MTSALDVKDIYLPEELTDAQKRAVTEDGEIIVSASAGSGKSSTMIKRILRLLLEGVSLKDMLVLVYNNAAADELREKLHDALFAVACRLDGEKQELIKKQLDELSFAHISTIHAFCQSLIKENFSVLGISPTFEVLDENANDEYMNEALDNVFNAYGEEEDETFERISEIFSRHRKDDNLKENIKRLFNTIDIQSDKDAFFDNVRECYKDFEDSKFFDIILAYEHDFFGKAAKVLKPCKELFDNCEEVSSLLSYRAKIANAYDTAVKIATANSFTEMCKAAYEFRDTTVKLNNCDEAYTSVVPTARLCISDMKEEMAELKIFFGNAETIKKAHEQSGKIIEKLIEIVGRFGKELARLKEEDNVLGFEDLQHKAVELLTTESVNLKKYKQVFVDEYQDVNPTQEFIISKLVDGNCFMVGDTKQSIYAFRLADPTNFSNRQARYERGEGTAIYFNRNFRSARQILEAVNGVFDVIMTVDSAGVDYKRTARFELENAVPDGDVELHLFKLENAKEQKDGPHGVYDITTDEESAETLTSADAEGIFIANKIKELYGRAIGDDGYLRYGDFSVLFHSRSANAQRVINRLRQAGIPIDDSGFEKTKSAPERELMLILNAIDNPRQDIAFAGYLLSFFGGYTEEELAQIAALDAGTFYDKFLIYSKKDDALAKKILATMSVLDRYRVKASFKNVKELAGGIVADFSYDAYLMKNGEADVYGLKAFIAGISDKDNESLGRFLREYGTETSKRSAQTECDRVHVSTFHGYKGLENEVVFVSDLGATFNSKDVSGDLTINPKGYLALNYFDFDRNEKSEYTLSKFAVKKLHDKKTVGEEMRLMYVAMTRAKRYMYLTSSITETKRKNNFGEIKRIALPHSMLDLIGNALADGCNLKTYNHTEEDFSSASANAVKYVLPPADKVLEREILAAQTFEYPHENATRLAIKYSVSALDSLDEQAVSAFAEGEFKNVGTIYHKVMQHVDYFAKGVDGVKREIERLLQEKLLTEEEIATVREVDGENFESKIETCLASDIVETARKFEKQGRCFREKAFMMYKPAREIKDDFDADEKVLVQGVIDLFIDGDEKIIVDFKNSNLKDKETLKKYEKQLNLYKMAVESAICAKVDKIMLYSFKTGKTVEL